MAKKLKLSPWHSGDVKPVHVGVYQRVWNDGDVVFTKWAGNYWTCSYSTTMPTALIDAHKLNSASFEQSLKWRGIIK